MCRNPFDSWISNKKTYSKLIAHVPLNELWYYDTSKEELLYYHIMSYRQLERISLHATQIGIKITHYAIEANKFAETTIPNLFCMIMPPKEEKRIPRVAPQDPLISESNQAAAALVTTPSHAPTKQSAKSALMVTTGWPLTAVNDILPAPEPIALVQV